MPSKGDKQVLWATLARPLLAVFGLGVCVTCGLAAWQRAAPLSAPSLFPFAETWYAKSVAASAPAEGVADAQMAAHLAPTHAENWMLLAYQYSRADRGVSPRVVAAVRQSYAASPLTVDASAYRLSFILNAWPDLPEDVHRMAEEEARQWGTTPPGVVFLQKITPTIADPKAHFEFAVITMVARFQFLDMISNSQKH